MGREIVTKGMRFYCVSLQPDICKTPIGPSTPAIPYTIKGEFAEATGVSKDIRSNGEKVVIHASTVIPTVTGDEQGTAKGVKSGTVSKRVQHDQRSATVKLNGERAIRVGDTVFMNDKNTIGKIYERGGGASGFINSSPGNSVGSQQLPRGESGGGAESSFAKRFHEMLLVAKNPQVAIQALGGDAIRSTTSAFDLNLDQLLAPAALIPASLLNKIPGGVAARTLDKARRIAGLLGRGGGMAPLSAFKDVPEMAQGTSGGLDWGTSPDKSVGMVPNTVPSYPPPPKVTGVGGDIRVVNRELAKLPENVLSTLRSGNIEIITVRDTIVEAFPELHNVVPRGWGGLGKTWDDVPGIFKPDRGTVAVATSDKNSTGSGNMILHEVGHAYDYAMGELSQSLSFSAAYEADKKHYSAYYLQAGVAGREEVFAESFANYYSENYSYFAGKPHVLGYWKNLPQAMQSSGRTK